MTSRTRRSYGQHHGNIYTTLTYDNTYQRQNPSTGPPSGPYLGPNTAPPTGPINSAPTTGPTNFAPTTGPTHPAPPTGPIYFYPPTGPTHPAPPTGPINFAPPTGPTHPGPFLSVPPTGPPYTAPTIGINYTQTHGSNLPTSVPISGLRPGTSLRPMGTHTQHDDASSIAASVVTTPSTTSRATNKYIASYFDQDLHSSSRSKAHSPTSRDPGMIIPAFPVDHFEAYIHWFCNVFGNKKMFLSLDFPTLYLWFRDYFYVSSYQEVHNLTSVPPKVILSAFGYVPAQHTHDDLIELMVIIQFINHQMSSHTSFPWSLDPYFTFRMIQHPRTKENYKIPLSPPQSTPHSHHVIRESHSPPVRASGSYHITPSTCLSHHDEDVSIQSYQQGGNGKGNRIYQSVPAFKSFKSYVDRMNRHNIV